MKFSLDSLPDEIYFHLYDIDRTVFGDIDEEESLNMLALWRGGAIEITREDHLFLYTLERGEISFDYFYEKMKGIEIIP